VLRKWLTYRLWDLTSTVWLQSTTRDVRDQRLARRSAAFRPYLSEAWRVAYSLVADSMQRGALEFERGREPTN
jgi:hypothetical protein